MDWADQNRHRGIRASGTQTQTVALAEDDCTCLAEAPTAGPTGGQLYVGHRHAGIDALDPARNRVAIAADSIFAKAILSTGHVYIGTYSGPGGVVALDTLSYARAAPILAMDVRPTGLPSGAPPIDVAELAPGAELHNLKDLYAAGQFQQVLTECVSAEDDQRYSDWHPQLLYLAWASDEKLGNIDDGDRLRNSFLQQYPRHIFAADMYFEQAMRLLADAQYQAADDELAMIEGYFPASRVAEKATGMRMRLKSAIPPMASQ
jgi:hypothetical protein